MPICRKKLWKEREGDGGCKMLALSIRSLCVLISVAKCEDDLSNVGKYDLFMDLK